MIALYKLGWQKIQKFEAYRLAWMMLYSILLLVSLQEYLPFKAANFWLGLVIMCIYCLHPIEGKGSFRFFWWAIVCSLSYCFLPVNTLLFGALLFGIMFTVEQWMGRISNGVFLIIALMGPIANYGAEIFGFPIRLQLTQWAAKILVHAGLQVRAEGNILLLNGQYFSVDPACMGLNMFVLSLLICLLVILLTQRNESRQLPFHFQLWLLAFFAVTNVVANLLRIICLVYFQILPEHWLHELVGMACWLMWGILPGFWLIRFLVRQVGYYRPYNKLQLSNAQHKHYNFAQVALLLVFTLVHLTPPHLESNSAIPKDSLSSIRGYEVKKMREGIIQLRNAESLVYIKPIRGFFSTDHNPSICWMGSGYRFAKVQKQTTDAGEVYTAILEKGNEQLYTAWWYQSQEKYTIRQLNWRWDNLKTGNPYQLVNITASNPLNLNKAIQDWMQQTLP